MHDGNGFMFSGGGIMWIFWIIIIVVLILIIKGLFSRGVSSATGSPTENALEILKKRYAKGEIDEAEYEKRKAELSKD